MLEAGRRGASANIQRPREGQGQKKRPADRMNAQSTLDSTSTAASGDQDDPGSCTSSHASTGDDGEGESASPGENREQLPDAASGTGLDISDVRADCVPVVDVVRVADLLGEAAMHIDRPVARVSVQLVDDGAMTTLHREHCNIDSTTDVLTFDATLSDAAPIEVDIAVCVDEAGRQATARGHAIEHEVLLYALHGIMHCLGYDDHDEADFAAMHAEEDRLLRLIGIGPVFDRSESGKAEDGR